MAQLARLHTPSFRPTSTSKNANGDGVEQGLREDLDRWADIAGRHRVTRSPLARLAIRILRHTLPAAPRASVHAAR